MEDDRRRKKISSDKFSFPDMSESEFEFDYVTRESPRSPADHIFANGKLLPHFFPIQSRNSTSYSRSMSRTSSISSKESFLSSRCNSSNSSSSNSARTSISTETCSYERKISSQGKIQVAREKKKQGEINKPVLTCQQYGWQFIAPMPAVLNHQNSTRRKRGAIAQEGLFSGRKRCALKYKSEKKNGFFKKKLMSFVSTCSECHAMNPSGRERVLKAKFEHFQ